MADHFFKKTLTGLAPSTQEAEEWLAEIPRGEILRIKASRPRNVGHMRKFFALLNLIHQNQTHYKTVEEILTVFKLRIGHGHWIHTKTKDGLVDAVWHPHSISFARMDQAAFNEFYRKAVDFVVAEVIPGLDKADLERELREYEN